LYFVVYSSCEGEDVLYRTIDRAVQEIRRRIAAAAGETSVTLVAAGKTQSAEAVKEAVRAGVDAVGENRVQEMMEKQAGGAYEGCALHFIGHLQKNKVKQVAGRAGLIHSVDSMSLAEAIDAYAVRLGVVQDVLLQVNIAFEDTKSGFPPDAVPGALNELSPLRSIRVRGLMCIPPPIFTVGEERYFERMRELYEAVRHNTAQAPMDVLSMGMSDDFELAIRAGANMVRVGSALFGARG
jgi:hypothetical protein